MIPNSLSIPKVSFSCESATNSESFGESKFLVTSNRRTSYKKSTSKKNKEGKTKVIPRSELNSSSLIRKSDNRFLNPDDGYLEVKRENNRQEVNGISIPKTEFVMQFAFTHFEAYNVSTIRYEENKFETRIMSSTMKDELEIGNYKKISTNKKTALDNHIEAIWHLHHSVREGL